MRQCFLTIFFTSKPEDIIKTDNHSFDTLVMKIFDVISIVIPIIRI